MWIGAHAGVRLHAPDAWPASQPTELLCLLQLPTPLPTPTPQVLFRHVLLGAGAGLPPVLLGPAAAGHLLSHFQRLDPSVETVRSALQLAAALHHQQQPLSSLCPAAASGDRAAIRKAVAALPAALLKHASPGPAPPGSRCACQRRSGGSNRRAGPGPAEPLLWAAQQSGPCSW
jgi:hypothetical protein